jgi:hypothetical protein
MDDRDRTIRDLERALAVCRAGLADCARSRAQAVGVLTALAALTAEALDGAAAELARLGRPALAEAMRATGRALRDAAGVATPATAADLAATLAEVDGWLWCRTGRRDD